MAKITILLTLAMLIPGDVISSLLRQPSYWQLRQDLLMKEQQQALGGELKLGVTETKANKILMTAKNEEIRDGFRTGNTFLPSRNFMEVIPEIEKSEVFKILRELPKGGILHAHDTAIVSADYRFHNLTYRDNLYVCESNGVLFLKFFNVPNNECDWRLLKDVRRDPEEAKVIDRKIKERMSMLTNNPNSVYNTVDKAWTKFSSVFKFMGPVIRYRPVYEDYIYRGLQEFYDDNVMYVELRTTLGSVYDLDGKVYQPLEVAKIQKEVSERFMKDHPDFIDVKIIYSPPRFNISKIDEELQTMSELTRTYPDFVIGFDLVGQEDKGQPLTSYADKLNAASPKIKYFFHAGETNWNGENTDLNLLDAILLNTKRIGHGYALTKHPFLWHFIKQLDIAVEICPISNQVLGLVRDMRNHPAASLFAEGSPVVISNDDPGHWGAKGLSYDFYEAFMGIMSASSDLRSLKKLAQNSLIYSGMPESMKSIALKRWQFKWDSFVDKLAKLLPDDVDEPRTIVPPSKRFPVFDRIQLNYH